MVHLPKFTSPSHSLSEARSAGVSLFSHPSLQRISTPSVAQSRVSHCNAGFSISHNARSLRPTAANLNQSMLARDYPHLDQVPRLDCFYRKERLQSSFLHLAQMFVSQAHHFWIVWQDGKAQTSMTPLVPAKKTHSDRVEVIDVYSVVFAAHLNQSVHWKLPDDAYIRKSTAQGRSACPTVHRCKM